MSSSHVLFIVTNYPPHQGGVEQHVAALAGALPGRGVRATVVCLGDEPGTRTDGEVTVHTLRRRLDLGMVLAVPEPREWHRRVPVLLRGVSHISTHTRFFPMSFLGVRLGQAGGTPVIHTEHGADFVTTPSRALNTGAKMVDRTAGAWVLNRAREVLSVSGRVSEFVRRLSGRSSTVIGNGIHLADWWPDTPPVAAPRLVFVGRLVEEKGWRDFLDIVEATRDVPHLEAVIAGDGPQRDAVHREIYARGLGTTVRLVGSVDHAVLREHFMGAVYVNPSVAAEGFQLTLLESLAAGARLASYDVGVAGELRAAGMPVSVVQVGDKQQLEAATRAELLQPSAPASHHSLRQWDWGCVADRYVEILRQTS